MSRQRDKARHVASTKAWRARRRAEQQAVVEKRFGLGAAPVAVGFTLSRAGRRPALRLPTLTKSSCPENSLDPPAARNCRFRHPQGMADRECPLEHALAFLHRALEAVKHGYAFEQHRGNLQRKSPQSFLLAYSVTAHDVEFQKGLGFLRVLGQRADAATEYGTHTLLLTPQKNGSGPCAIPVMFLRQACSCKYTPSGA